MEQRTVQRFSRMAIVIHWVHMAAFVVLIISGALMFFHLTGFSGGREIRTIHKVSAVFFIAVPILAAFFNPQSALGFLAEAFLWSRDDVLWLKSAVSYYFGNLKPMPPQDRINGDQKLWQLIVIVTGLVFILTGITQWFFRLKIPVALYEWILLIHAAAFIIAAGAFLMHLYLRMLHPKFNESLSSILDGKVSVSYAREHYSKWYTGKIGKDISEEKSSGTSPK